MIERYNKVHIALHWLIALLIFITFPLGLYMADLKLSPTMLKLFSYHKWIGVTIFFLVAIRLGWRATHPVPPPMAGMPRWQETVSVATHRMLYLLMVAIPLSGWLTSSADGFQTVWLGIVPLPDLLDKNKELGDTLGAVHEYLNWALLALVVLHAAAAIKHHFIDKDGLLQRMNPFSARKAAS